MTTLIDSKTLYDKDFNLWIETTVKLLKNGNFQEIDLDNLIDEIESMGRSDKREISNRLIVLIMHLLKWKFQSEKRTNSWIYTINEQRRKLLLILKDSPSLKPFLEDNFEECYGIARLNAATETNLSERIFPVNCPFTQQQVLTTGYLPD